jgi:tripartite-type tricarboxylate transporter receptor subunit TctC
MATAAAAWRVSCAAIVALSVNISAQAQEYPAKPVTLITPAAAGNSPDVVMRVAADRLSRIWNRQIVVINRPGAGGLLALQAAAAAEKDGYTLYMTQASTYTVLPIEQQGKLPVDLQTAFTPIGMVSEQPIGLAVNKDVPAKDIAQLIALANATPGGMFFGATNAARSRI